jgi:uncharacterized hydantoinase/oxoprolinase family protein
MAEAAWTGLDVGGAHLKVAQVDRDGRVTAALQVPCALWQGLDRLDAALDTALRDVAPTGAVAVTMTGELVDLFPDRATGVRRLVDHLLPLGGSSGLLRFWAGRDGFVDSATASARPLDVASANWLATATLAARRVPDAASHRHRQHHQRRPGARGRRGARARLERSGTAGAEELVYTGATRTPLMALAREVPFLGERVPLTAEYFATTADVWRVMGFLPDGADQHPCRRRCPEDGRGQRPPPRPHGRRRPRRRAAGSLDGPRPGVRPRAGGAAAARRRAPALARPADRRRAARRASAAGSFVVRRLADRLGRPYRDFAGSSRPTRRPRSRSAAARQPWRWRCWRLEDEVRPG